MVKKRMHTEEDKETVEMRHCFGFQAFRYAANRWET